MSIVRDPYRPVIGCCRALFWLLGLRFDVQGARHIPEDGAAVLAANHTSYLDFTFVGLAASKRGRVVRFMAKSGVFDAPVAGRVMRAMRHIPVVRSAGAGAYRQARRELERGELVGLFPESTISRSWTLKPLLPGAAALAIDRQVPLLPVVTWGGHRILTVDGRWSVRRGTAVTILVGPALRPGPDADLGETVAVLHAALTTLLDRAQRDYPQQPRGAGDQWWLPAHLGGTAPTAAEGAELDTAALARSVGVAG